MLWWFWLGLCITNKSNTSLNRHSKLASDCDSISTSGRDQKKGSPLLPPQLMPPVLAHPPQTTFIADASNSAAVAAAPPLVWLWGWTCSGALWFWCLSWPRQSGVNGLLPVCGAVRLWHTGWVSDGSVEGPLGWPRVGEGWIQSWGLAGVAVVRAGGVVLGIFCKLSSWGQWGEGRAVVRQAERGIGDVSTSWGCFCKVTPSTRSLALDLCLGRVRAQRGAVVLLRLLLGEPGCWVSAGRSQSWRDAVGVGGGCRSTSCASNLPNAWVPIRGKVLVKLVDVKRLHVGHHLMAHLTNVHITKVDVRFSRSRGTWTSFCSQSSTERPLPSTLPLTFPWLPRLRLGFRSGGRRGRTVALTCRDTRM